MRKSNLSLFFALCLLGHAQATTRYVALNGGHVSPFINWANAATTIQAAVDVSVNGDLVLVSNGVYNTGGRTVGSALLTNRVVITNAITVQSVNGPNLTSIEGQGPLGDSAIRCVYFNTNAQLIGFTITNGYTRTTTAIGLGDTDGGGVYSVLDRPDGILSNCVIVGCHAFGEAGGVYSATLFNSIITNNHCVDLAGGLDNCVAYNCVVSGNSADVGGGANGTTFSNSLITLNSAYQGGGTFYSTLHSCTISNNTAVNGGGDSGSTIYNSVVVNNFASNFGGGVSGSTVYNSIIAGNAANRGGGIYDGVISNCSIYANHAYDGGGLYEIDALTDSMVYSNRAHDGGGINSGAGVIRNCSFFSNFATNDGGGIFSGLNLSVISCILSNNVALRRGGGGSGGQYSSSFIMGNSAGFGGGVYTPIYASNCIVALNAGATEWGGIAGGGPIVHCTVVSNSNGGVYQVDSVENSVVYFNSVYNYDDASSFSYSCSTGLAGSGNITNNPRLRTFGGHPFSLNTNSPCIDAGAPSGTMPYDYVGIPRPLDGNNDGSSLPDMGAYEYVNTNADSDADGLTDGDELNTYTSDPTDADTDDDRQSDGDEAVANTDILDAYDFFRITTYTNGIIHWTGSAGRLYSVVYSPSCTSAYQVAGNYSNVNGISGSMSYTNSLTNTTLFLGLRVQLP